MKITDARQHWNHKYREGLPSLEKPDPFFLWAYGEFVAGTEGESRRALDLAGGLGRHALWLARRSWAVRVVDISEVALRSLEEKAEREGVNLDLVVTDIASFGFLESHYDLILMYYHFDRRVSVDVVRSLKPGGLLICKSSVAWQPYERDGSDETNPLARGEILSILADLKTLHHSERPVRDRGVVEYVGRRCLR